MTIDEINNRLELYRTNPNAIQRYVLELLETVSKGEHTITSPSNPFVFLLEASVMLSSTAMDESRSRVREMYPVLATKPEDIYRHMSDTDYINQFSIPSKIEMSLVFKLNELLNMAIGVSDQIYKKITIPKESIFSINNIDFGIHYPIDIRVTPYDGLQIVYETTTPSPLGHVSDNNIDFNYFNFNSEHYINVTLAMEQYTLSSYVKPVNISVGFNYVFEYGDYFYYCRVYTMINNQWIEINTTHSKEIYDVTKATARLTLLDNKVEVSIPLIYFTSKLIGTEVRVDIYTTKGDIVINLGNYTQDNSSFQWRDLDNNNNNRYSAPLGKMSYNAIYSTSITSGGKNGETFEQIRDRVVNSRSRRLVPIRYSELETYLADRGYDLIKSIDTITDRLFLATKKLPNYGNLTPSISGSIETVIMNYDALSGNYVKNHGTRFTIMNRCLFKSDNGIITKLPDNTIELIYSYDNLDLLAYLNANDIVYNPMHYVLDTNDEYLTYAAYFLSFPKLISRWKIAEDTSSGYQIASNKFTFVYNDKGYVLTLSTKSNQKIKLTDDSNIYVQLSYSAQNETDKVFLNGVYKGLVDGHRVYEFILASQFNINRDNYIEFDNFSKTNTDVFSYFSKLEGDFHLVFAVANPERSTVPSEASLYNHYLGHHLLPKNAQVLTVELLRLHFGEPMDLLLSNSRTSVSHTEYERYDCDVPAVYTENVFKRDSNGLMEFITDEHNNSTPIVLHAVGDSVLDEANNPIYRFKKGDIKLKNGKPIIVKDRATLYMLDTLLLEAMYLFTDVLEQKEIFDSIPKLINDALNNDLKGVLDILLERTNLYYCPKRTVGKITVQIDKDNFISINSSQSICVTYYLTPTMNLDYKLKKSIEEVTIDSILSWINQPTVSTDNLSKLLKEKNGNSVLAVNCKWVGELSGIDTFTIIDQTQAINIKQKLQIGYDQSRSIADDITISYTEQRL